MKTSNPVIMREACERVTFSLLGPTTGCGKLIRQKWWHWRNESGFPETKSSLYVKCTISGH